MGSEPPLIGGNPRHPHPHGLTGRPRNQPSRRPGGHGAARHRVIGGGTSGQRGGARRRGGGARRAFEKKEAELLQLEVSGVLSACLQF
jgi:hypothetical protein